VDGHPANDFLVSAPPLARIRATPESRDSNCPDYTHGPGNVKEESLEGIDKATLDLPDTGLPGLYVHSSLHRA